MTTIQPTEFEEFNEDAELIEPNGVKDTKARQKYQARRRIDELLEQKRLRELIDDWDLLED